MDGTRRTRRDIPAVLHVGSWGKGPLPRAALMLTGQFRKPQEGQASQAAGFSNEHVAQIQAFHPLEGRNMDL